MAGSETNHRAQTGRPAKAENVISVTRECHVRCGPSELYAFWREPENLSAIVNAPLTITKKSARESHWSVAGPLGIHIEWDAVIEEEEPNRRIAWRSTAGAGIANAGEVRFEPSGDDATRVCVSLQYRPPGGPLGSVIARFGTDAVGSKLEEALRRLKERMETRQT